MKSALDNLIEELEAGTWQVPEVSQTELANGEREGETQGKAQLAPCGSAHCAGCYDVGDGRKIHPPKCGEGYRAWLERWQPKGKPQ